MFWPLNLPFVGTVLVLVATVTFCTLFAPILKWKRLKTFGITTLFACIAFIPSVLLTMKLVDAFRFGIFHYDTFSDVNDFRIERYLPTMARQITVHKYPHGHRAKYSISEADLMEYLDGLWDKYGERSATSREELHSDSVVNWKQRDQFGYLGWPVLENALELHSPRRSNRAGASYFFDRKTGTAYQRAGYW
jgi:hypothetical protein